ncbi:MAG: hypothetical protein M1133_12005 [Armatimonadetes bacterium]|nr:hypothetical protein [Armatimonadota bacterium]
MRATKIAYVAVAVVIASVAVIGLAKTRNGAVEKDDAQTSRAVDAASAVVEKPASKPEPAASKPSSAEAAISAAAKQNRYVFVTFYRKNDDASKKMLTAMKSAQGKLSHRADFVSVDVGDAVQQDIVSRYGADRSPIPLTLVVAPNGAVTAGFPNEIKKTDFSAVFLSDGMASVIKVLQDRKLAAVCVQGSSTRNNKKSLATAEELKADPALGGAVEIVRIDPSDRSESRLMKECKVDVHSTSAQLLVLAPPGKLVGKFDGTATKDTIMASLKSSLGGGGCGGGSCGPSGCP